MILFVIVTFIVISIFSNYLLFLAIGIISNSLLLYNVHTELLHQLNLKYTREYKDKKPLDNE